MTYTIAYLLMIVFTGLAMTVLILFIERNNVSKRTNKKAKEDIEMEVKKYCCCKNGHKEPSYLKVKNEESFLQGASYPKHHGVHAMDSWVPSIELEYECLNCHAVVRKTEKIGDRSETIIEYMGCVIYDLKQEIEVLKQANLQLEELNKPKKAGK